MQVHQDSFLKDMVATKFYVAIPVGKCHYKAHVVILLVLTKNHVFLLLLSVFKTRYSTYTLAIVGILAWMALKRLLVGTKGPIKQETVVDHESQSMV